MADTRTSEQKKADNLKEMISSGAKNPDTLSEKSKKILSDRGDNVLQTPNGVYVIPKDTQDSSSNSVNPKDAIQTPYGVYSPGSTPFEQLQNKKGSFYESAKMGYEGFKITQQYNPGGLDYAMGQGLDRYSENYGQAKQKAVNERMYIQNVPMFEQSAIGDMIQTGFFVSTADIISIDDATGQATYGEPYIGLSDRGKNFGEENIYKFEENAWWGKAFDWIISDDKVYVYPEGTRKSMAEAGFDVVSENPMVINRDGTDYLIVQKEGRNTINVKAINPLKNQLDAAPTAIDISEFLDLGAYETQPNTIIDYTLDEGGITATATGLKEKDVFPDGWAGGSANFSAPDKPSAGTSEWKPAKYVPPYKVGVGYTAEGETIWGTPGQEFTILSPTFREGYTTKQIGGQEFIVNGFELSEGKFINPQGIPYNPANPEEYAMYGVSTPSREFFWTNYGEVAKDFVKGFEPKEWKLDFKDQGVVIRPSDVFGYGVSIPETILKGALAPPTILVGVAARQGYIPFYGEAERNIAAGTGITAAFGGLAYTPQAVTFGLMSFVQPATTPLKATADLATSKLGNLLTPAKDLFQWALPGSAKAVTFLAENEIVKSTVSNAIAFGGAQAVIEFTSKFGTTFLSDEFENTGYIEQTAGMGPITSRMVNANQGAYATAKNEGIEWGILPSSIVTYAMAIPVSVYEYVESRAPVRDFEYSFGKAMDEMLSDKGTHQRIATAAVFGGGFGFTKSVVGSAPVKGLVKKVVDTPKNYFDSTGKLASGAADLAVPGLNKAGGFIDAKINQAATPTGFGTRQRFRIEQPTTPNPVSPELAVAYSRMFSGGFKGVTRPIEMKYPKSEIVNTNILPPSDEMAAQRQQFKNILQQTQRKNFSNDLIGAGGFETGRSISTPNVNAFARPDTKTDSSFLGRMRQDARWDDINREKGRTRSEMALAARQEIAQRNAFGVGLGQRTSQRDNLYVGVRTSIGEGVGIFEITPELTTTHQLERTRLKPPTTRPPILFPTFIKLGGSSSKNHMPKIRQPKNTRTSYAPSLAGVLGGKIEKKTKKMYSGFEVRGIQRRKNKYGLF